jgi:hypothetical protein
MGLRHWWARVRRSFSRGFTRGPALLRRMGVQPSPVDPSRRGFVIVQVDGLSHPRMTRAVRRRQMPFLRKMLRTGAMKAHRFYSELPTSTPAFQAGLFYGDNSEIPGFQFYDKRAKRHFRMGRTEFAQQVEDERANPGVMRGGSVFSAVFTGDAEASLFVFSTMLDPSRWRFALRAWDILLLSVANIFILFRILALGIVELALGVYDSVKWYLKKGIVRREAEFIASRLALTVIGRETITLGAVIDIHRGVPAIYLNYLGYDENSHLRGPDSKVARWTLLGIDRCIRRVHAATLHAPRRYDFFVMSDHGQCPVKPFELVEGVPLGDYLQGQLTGLLVESDLDKDERAAQLGSMADGLHRIADPMPRAFRKPMRAYAKFLRKRILPDPLLEEASARLDVVVVSSGPIAYAYWTHVDRPLSAEEVDSMHPDLLDALANHRAIGFVSLRTQAGDVLVHSRGGQALVGASSVRLSGRLPFDRSPCRARIIESIRRLTLMRRAGDICIWGAHSPSGHISYSYEFGGHSGCTDDETGAFVIAPARVGHDFSTITRHDQFYEFFNRYHPADARERAAAS